LVDVTDGIGSEFLFPKMTISTEIFPSTSLESIKSNPAVYEKLEETLTNKNGQVSLHKRFRVIFTLKNLADEKSIDILAKGK
jgi:deoxyhypusine monooxygenase